MTQPLVIIGRVVKAHGIHGEVVVDVLSDVPGRFEVDAIVLLDGEAVRIAGSRPHQGRLLVAFEGVDDRTAAERLRGREIEAETVDLGESETYFVHELVGLRVIGDAGRDLGVVEALIELPAAAGYDLLEVRRQDGSSWWLPAVDEYVEVEEDATGASRLVLVDPPEGLIEDEPTFPQHGSTADLPPPSAE